MLDLINAALATWMPLGIYQESGREALGMRQLEIVSAEEAEEGEAAEMPQPFADDDDDNLWGEGFADSSIRTLFPLWACTNICTGISSIGADTHTHTGIRKNNKLFTIFIVCDCDC